jgi:hypothetical protein
VLKDVPTIVEAGYPQLASEDWAATMVKAGTPPAVIARPNEAVNKALKTDISPRSAPSPAAAHWTRSGRWFFPRSTRIAAVAPFCRLIFSRLGLGRATAPLCRRDIPTAKRVFVSNGKKDASRHLALRFKIPRRFSASDCGSGQLARLRRQCEAETSAAKGGLIVDSHEPAMRFDDGARNG